jgi:hypothetical protein
MALGTPTAIDESIEVKGTPVRAMVAFVDKRLTPQQKERLVRALPPAAAGLLARRAILPVETVPVTTLNRITEMAARESGIPVDAFAHEAGRAAADEAVHGIWKLAAALVTPTTLLAKGSRLWSTVYSRGRLDIEQPSAGLAVVTLADFPCEAVCCARISGWYERLFELARAKNIRVEQIECCAKGAPACRWTLRWE